MGLIARRSILWLVVVLALVSGLRNGYSAEARFALVIGNDQYKTATLLTPANDAGLVADALQAAGFTVTGARNLDQATLRESVREFIDQVSAAGPDAVAVIYLSGFGLQFEGDNYFIPVDADIRRDVDIPLQAIRMSDVIQPLSALPGRVKIVILDAARQNQFAGGGQPLAGGLTLVDPAPGMAIAFNAAPGTVGPQEPGPYGAYAAALAEMIAAGGLSLDDIFGRVRLRVSELTQGAEVPWYASKIGEPFYLTERAADAPPPPNVTPLADIRNKPIRAFANVDDAYAAALERDNLDGYEQFLVVYPNSPYSRRIAAMLAVRREEFIWRRCVMTDTPQAYWSYLRRYPNGPHVWDARRRLMMIRAAIDPPPEFAFVDFGVPPPQPAELVFVNQPLVVFMGPGFSPPPPPPLFFLPPRPREFSALPPPPPPRERFGLPVPGPAIVPAFVKPPATVRPAAGVMPGTRPGSSVSLPAAIQHGGTPGVPKEHRPGLNGPTITSPHPATPPQPPTALVKPGSPPPPPSPPQPGPKERSTFKPAPTPSPPSQTEPKERSTFKPSPPPPPPAAPAVAKPPVAPPPHPPAPANVKPPPPPAKPECPPGKKLTPEGCK